MKAKSTWMYFNLIQQGRSGAVDDEERFGPREDWSQLWTDGVEDKVKVVKPAETVWETTRDGRVRVLASKDTPHVRVFSVDVYEQEIPPGSRSAKHWHMADEVAYVIAGTGESLQWEVEAEIAERYYARVAKEPTTWEFKVDDTVYVPQNHQHQYVNTGDEPLRLLVVQNRLIKYLGYDKVVYLEDAPEFTSGERATAGATA
jgi:oxalate decarboxylase/phosphoglucose isomerase-like protein (cupin superfamily)